MSFTPLYKCRLCGEEYQDSRTFPGDLNQLTAHVVRLDEDGGYYLNGHSISITESHICDDGNVGIAELRGFIETSKKS